MPGKLIESFNYMLYFYRIKERWKNKKHYEINGICLLVVATDAKVYEKGNVQYGISIIQLFQAQLSPQVRKCPV